MPRFDTIHNEFSEAGHDEPLLSAISYLTADPTEPDEESEEDDEFDDDEEEEEEDADADDEDAEAGEDEETAS